MPSRKRPSRPAAARKVTFEIDPAVLTWWRSWDAGISSKTIAHVLGGVPWLESFHPDIPHDPSDFGRCHRLLALFPAWRVRLGEVAKRYPVWAPMVREWAAMEQLYREDFASGRSDRLFDLMSLLRVEAGRSAG